METQNLLRNILDTRDGLANLLAQLVKSKDANETELGGDLTTRVIRKLLDLAKVCYIILPGKLIYYYIYYLKQN